MTVKLLAAVIGLTLSAAQAQAGWTCSAKGLVDYKFDGGGCATIHLKPYPYGNCYDVSIKGNVATGVTSDGTPFTCRKK